MCQEFCSVLHRYSYQFNPQNNYHRHKVVNKCIQGQRGSSWQGQDSNTSCLIPEMTLNQCCCGAANKRGFDGRSNCAFLRNYTI